MINNTLIKLSIAGVMSCLVSACNIENADIYGRRNLPQGEKAVIPKTETNEAYSPKWITLDGGQREFEFNPRVDILFIVDNSASMTSAQENLSKNINKFVAGFSRNNMIDFHIGVVSVWDSSERFKNEKKDPYKNGELRHPKREQGASAKTRYITRTQNVSDVLASTLKLGVVPLEEGGPENEEVFSPLAAAISGINEPNADFFRDDAQLVVVIITDADDSTSRDPQNPAMGLTPNQMAEKLFDFKSRHGGAEKVSVYAALVSKTDPDSAKDYVLQVHPKYHPDCFEIDTNGKFKKDDNGKYKTIEGKCTGFGPDRIEEFVVAANSGRGNPAEVKSKFIMSLTQKDFGDDLAKIGSDISVKTLAKEIPLPERPRLDKETGLIMIKVSYGSEDSLKAGKGQLIPLQQKGGWLYDAEKNSIKLAGDIVYKHEEGARFQVEMVPLSYTVPAPKPGK
ncbi:MAG: hypothetical protein AB7O96_10975 [Pseudobdellovibrionaceae bacterium]